MANTVVDIAQDAGKLRKQSSLLMQDLPSMD
jgi:hypothetical protein